MSEHLAYMVQTALFLLSPVRVFLMKLLKLFNVSLYRCLDCFSKKNNRIDYGCDSDLRVDDIFYFVNSLGSNKMHDCEVSYQSLLLPKIT